MENALAEALVVKGILPAGTEVEARYKAVALGGVANVKVTGYFSVVKAGKRSNGEVVFTLAALSDGATVRVPAEDVLNIDGMDPERFASVYGIKACGGNAAPKARRGRKPKDRSIKPALPTPANDDGLGLPDVA